MASNSAASRSRCASPITDTDKQRRPRKSSPLNLGRAERHFKEAAVRTFWYGRNGGQPPLQMLPQGDRWTLACSGYDRKYADSSRCVVTIQEPRRETVSDKETARL